MKGWRGQGGGLRACGRFGSLRRGKHGGGIGSVELGREWARESSPVARDSLRGSRLRWCGVI